MNSHATAVLIVSACWPVFCCAQEETNWQHIDAPPQLVIEFASYPVGILFADDPNPGKLLSLRRKGASLRVIDRGRFGHILTGRKRKISGFGTEPIVIDASIDLCAFGFRLTGFDPHPQPRNRRDYTFTFFDAAGDVIGSQHRWPAGGTTRQAFRPASGDAPFRSIKIEENSGQGFGINSVKGQPCASLSS